MYVCGNVKEHRALKNAQPKLRIKNTQLGLLPHKTSQTSFKHANQSVYFLTIKIHAKNEVLIRFCVVELL